MNTDDIIARIDDNDSAARSADTNLAALTMLALARLARDEFPSAAYVVLEVTDQDHSGSLFAVALHDIDEQRLSDDMDRYDEIAWHLADSNKSVWLPYMTASDTPDKYRSDYVLMIDMVLAEISEDGTIR